MEPKTGSSRKKKWLVLVYLAGDNDLSGEMVWSLQEIKKASSTPGVRELLDVSVLFEPRGEPARRYDIAVPGGAIPTDSDGDLDRLSTSEVAGKKDLPVSALLERFLTERFRALGPAERSLVALSGHGSGALGGFLSGGDSSVSIPDLGKILARAPPGGKIEVLGLDSCQMSTIEVGYEVRKSVSYLVASEGLVFDVGWPYHRVIQSVAENGDSPPEAAKEIARRYLDFYRDYEVAGYSTDVSVCDLAKLEPVADAVSTLAKAMKQPLSRLAPDGIEEGIELGWFQGLEPGSNASEARAIRNAILLAHWSAQSYKCDRYSDLFDFAEQLQRFCPERGGAEAAAIRGASEVLMQAIRAAVLEAGSTGSDFQHSHGLSVYFPWSSTDYASEYRDLELARRTGWADFLETYHAATARLRREQGSHIREADKGKGLARDEGGREIQPQEPRRRSAAELAAKDVDAGTHKDVDAGTHKDVDAGTHKDVDAGTHKGQKGKSCQSTMKNPPDGFYPR